MALALVAAFASDRFAIAGESTMPAAKYPDNVTPAVSAKYVYTEDGQYSKSLDIPTYEWMPAQGTPKAMVLAIHGLTLHGRRFRILARTLAVNGVGFVALDMRGFGRCKFDDKKLFSTPTDDKTKIDHEKSYDDIVQLAKLIKAKNPDQRLIALGESLGCTFCVRLAAEHPELISAVVLSAPAVKVNKAMYAGKGQIRQGLKAVVKPSHEVDLRGFFTELCSNREDVQNEMIDDPLILKKVKLAALVKTDSFVDKTAEWGKKTDPHLAVLILQGSEDGCVNGKHVTELMNNMPSDDQNLAWRGNFGHLQLETIFMRAASIDAIASFLINHGRDGQTKLQGVQQTITDAGGILTK
jgi:alpha-beta hydrolase superfamily lysophospholipase